MTRYAARRDANHSPLQAVFEQMLAGRFTDTSAFGSGFGDGYGSYGLYGLLIEFKADAKADYTPAQIRFQNKHPGCVERCESMDDAIRICELIRRRGSLLAGS